MSELQRRMVYAYYLKDWEFDGGNRATLLKDASRIKPDEYEIDMKGQLFCPMCFTNVIRVPQDKDHSASNMEAHFRHLSCHRGVTCDLRSTQKAQGKKYSSSESVARAIDNEELVIVHSFMKEKPEQRVLGGARPFTEAQIEDVSGPETEVPLGVHDGETFKVPSRITSLRGICRNFEQNYYRYYFFPEYQHAIALTSLLHDTALVTDEDPKPKLYFAKLKNSIHFGSSPGPNNIRMTYLDKAPSLTDFCIKTPHWLQNEHGIGNGTEGRYVLIYGKITSNGIGLCFENLGWGELALIPEKYNYLIEDVYAAAHASD